MNCEFVIILMSTVLNDSTSISAPERVTYFGEELNYITNLVNLANIKITGVTIAA